MAHGVGGLGCRRRIRVMVLVPSLGQQGVPTCCESGGRECQRPELGAGVQSHLPRSGFSIDETMTMVAVAIIPEYLWYGSTA
jgi:hypothetical protein